MRPFGLSENNKDRDRKMLHPAFACWQSAFANGAVVLLMDETVVDHKIERGIMHRQANGRCET